MKFTKLHALLLASLFLTTLCVLAYTSSYYPSNRGDRQPFVDKAVNLPIVPFPSVPRPAQECGGRAFYYPQGVDGEQCVDKCPAPTLPDDMGHCKGGQTMP